MSDMFTINDDWSSTSKGAVSFKSGKPRLRNSNERPRQKSKKKEHQNINLPDESEGSLATNKNSLRADLTKSLKKKKLKNKKGTNVLTSSKQLIREILLKDENKICSASDKVSLEERLRQNLRGGHFRFLNEKLYTVDGATAKSIFEENPDDFVAYHEGYKHQVEQWPMNPLDRIIKYVKKSPRHFIIADFGCGEGRLAKSVPHKVYSIDLMASNPGIIACDMANTPLEDKCIDLAVYCLSLMGTNIKDFMLEANRVVKLGGTIYIAEIASRFDDVRMFISKMSSWGFDLTKKDLSHKLFCFFIFKKVRCVKYDECVDNFSLKPCLYKKR